MILFSYQVETNSVGAAHPADETQRPWAGKETDMQEYEKWLHTALDDPDLNAELLAIAGKPEEINDRFYRDLSFGTGGLRGVIGAGTNRMNVYTVRKATQGLANYLLAQGKGTPQSVAIAYDSRNKGEAFAKASAGVLAANGIKAYLYAELMPTPALSFAVRHLGCNAGICVTASHNPAKYNGYKAYGADGCQITSDMADGVTAEIGKLDIFQDVTHIPFEEGLAKGSIAYIEETVVSAFLTAVYETSLKKKAENLKVVYTPLNGSGKRCVLDILSKLGVRDVIVVPEQSEPDGNFPTCPYPNPEFREALERGLALSEKEQPDLLLATDPDCDRVGIAVNQKGSFELLSGNEVGILMLDYLIKIRKETNSMPSHPVAVTTIVSTDMVDEVARENGVELRRVLTGFKYIGDILAELEAEDRLEDYLLGFEESYGYLTGDYVRDKDAVNGSMVICEMASYYKEQGMTLVDAIAALYEQYGYYRNKTCDLTFEGEDGMIRMQDIMADLRARRPQEIAGYQVEVTSDYETARCYGPEGETAIALPVSNVLAFQLAGGHKFTVRPSGTEPKIKFYLSAKGESAQAADEIIDRLAQAIDGLVG